MKNTYEAPVMTVIEFSEETVMLLSYGDNFGSLIPGWGNP